MMLHAHVMRDNATRSYHVVVSDDLNAIILIRKDHLIYVTDITYDLLKLQ